MVTADSEDRCQLNAASDNVNSMELVKMPEQIRKLAYSIAERHGDFGNRSKLSV